MGLGELLLLFMEDSSVAIEIMCTLTFPFILAMCIFSDHVELVNPFKRRKR